MVKFNSCAFHRPNPSPPKIYRNRYYDKLHDVRVTNTIGGQGLKVNKNNLSIGAKYSKNKKPTKRQTETHIQ